MSIPAVAVRETERVSPGSQSQPGTGMAMPAAQPSRRGPPALHLCAGEVPPLPSQDVFGRPPGVPPAFVSAR